MQIRARNVVFVYRNGDADSLEVANYYRDERGVPADQIIPVSCSSNEVLNNYSEWRSQVEDDLRNALAAAPLSSRDIYVIILGYNVPGGFYDDNNVVSSVSRVMRLKHTYQYKEQNHYYVQKAYNGLYTVGDESYCYIASRIDGEAKEDALAIIDNNTELIQQTVVNGKLYLDPYFGIYDTSYNAYKDKMITFAAQTVPKINIELYMTELIDPYEDSVFACIEHDSFYWGGISDYAPEDFFYNTDTARCFFYNIDNFSAITVRDSSESYWVEKALSKGYCSAAGAMSTVIPSDYLDPTAFFLTLKDNDGNLGEAFLFSLPYFNCPITFIGDALAMVRYTSNSIQNNNVPNGFSPYYGSNAAPYAMSLRVYDVDISENCWTDSVTGDVVRISSINTEINITRNIRINTNTTDTWKRTLKNAITFVKWFAPVTHPTPCSILPSDLVEGETIDFDIDVILTISKPDTGIGLYYLRTQVQSARNNLGYTIKPAGYIKLFDGGIYYDIENRNTFKTANNLLEDYVISNNSYVLGKDGTSRVTNELFIDAQNSIYI